MPTESSKTFKFIILSFIEMDPLQFGKQLHHDCTHNKFHPLNLKISFFFFRFGSVFFHSASILFCFLLYGKLLMAGYYQGPPVMAPPQYYAAPPPRRQTGFLEGWLVLFTLFPLLLLFFFLAFH